MTVPYSFSTVSEPCPPRNRANLDCHSDEPCDIYLWPPVSPVRLNSALISCNRPWTPALHCASYLKESHWATGPVRCEPIRLLQNNACSSLSKWNTTGETGFNVDLGLPQPIYGQCHSIWHSSKPCSSGGSSENVVNLLGYSTHIPIPSPTSGDTRTDRHLVASSITAGYCIQVAQYYANVSPGAFDCRRWEFGIESLFFLSLQTIVRAYTAIWDKAKSMNQSQCHNTLVNWRLNSSGESNSYSLEMVDIALAQPVIGAPTYCWSYRCQVISPPRRQPP